MLNYAAAANPHCVDGFELNCASGRRDIKNVSEVGSVVGLIGSNQVTVNRLPMDLRVEIRKGLAQTVIQDPHAILVWSGIRLWGVVDEVVGKQFFEQLEIAVALHLFGVAPDYGLGQLFTFVVGYGELLSPTGLWPRR